LKLLFVSLILRTFLILEKNKKTIHLIRMKKITLNLFAMVALLSFALSSCGKKDNSEEAKLLVGKVWVVDMGLDLGSAVKNVTDSIKVEGNEVLDSMAATMGDAMGDLASGLGDLANSLMGALDMSMEFIEGGKMKSSIMGITVDGSWEISEGNLIMKGAGQETKTMKIVSLTADKLVLSSEKEGEQTFVVKK